jgi:hypothetical protein
MIIIPIYIPGDHEDSTSASSYCLKQEPTKLELLWRKFYRCRYIKCTKCKNKSKVSDKIYIEPFNKAYAYSISKRFNVW